MFQDHVNFLSTQNEKKGGLHDTFKKANAYLNKFPAGTLAIMGPADADMWWPTSKGSAGSTKWTRFSVEYFAELIKGNKHPYLRGTAPLSQLELRTGTTAKGTAWVDHHFQDNQQNCFKMSSILTNLLVVLQMFCTLWEAAVRSGRIAPNDSQGPRWKTGSGRGITLNTGYVRGETFCAELTLAQQKNEDSDKAEEDRLKLAALASIKMPQRGDYFEAGAAGASVYSSKDFSVISGFVNPGQYFGPIIDYKSYRLDSDTEFVAGLMVEFVD